MSESVNEGTQTHLAKPVRTRAVRNRREGDEKTPSVWPSF